MIGQKKLLGGIDTGLSLEMGGSLLKPRSTWNAFWGIDLAMRYYIKGMTAPILQVYYHYLS